MRTRLKSSCGWSAMLLPVVGSWTTVAAGEGPIVRQHTESEVEIDLGMIVDDFLPLIMEAAAADDESAPEKLGALAALLGAKALDRLHLRSSVDDERSLSSVTVTLDPSMDGGLLADLFSIPTARCRFGRYLGDEEPVLLLYASGIEKRIQALDKLFARAEFRKLAPMAPTDPLGFTAMWGVDARKEILPLLSGELDLIMFSGEPNETREVPSLALVLGLTDGPAFREKLLDVLTEMMGPEQGAALRDVPGEAAGEFTFYPMRPGISYGIADGFGVVTTDPDRLKKMVAGGATDSSPIDATSYLRVNVDLLVDLLGAMAESADAESPQAAVLSEVLEAVGEGPVGTIELTGRTGNGRLEVELRHPTTLYAAEYRLFKGLLAAAPKMQATAKRSEELRAIVHETDEALTRYGKEHDGHFPESLEQLVEAGYLEALPAVPPTPLGEYVDGGYTYLPLHDENGAAVGHYFFVYGGGENSGHDVFTPENLADPGSFRVAKDGKKDGVVGFSYDGIALEQVEEWGSD